VFLTQQSPGMRKALPVQVSHRFASDSAVFDDDNLVSCDLNGDRFVWLALYHPTRFWSSINQPISGKLPVPQSKRHASGR
jgi:hypothetical protein